MQITGFEDFGPHLSRYKYLSSLKAILKYHSFLLIYLREWIIRVEFYSALILIVLVMVTLPKK